MVLHVLRREGLTSVRDTCGIGICGACTVLLDGEPVSGCLLLAPQAAGRELTTVEGLPAEHPVPRGVRGRARLPVRLVHARDGADGQAPARGESRIPSDDQIADGPGGNLCRCGCYVKIRAAVRRAAAHEARDLRPGAGARVGVLEDGAVVDSASTATWSPSSRPARPPASAGRWATTCACWPRCGPRSLRDFLAFEGHLKGALGRLGRAHPGRVVRACPPTTRACPTP